MKKNEISSVWQFILLAVFMCPFLILGYLQNTKTKEKLKTCSFYTILHPIRMPDSHKMYFFFYHNGIKREDSTSVGATDLGAFYTKTSAINRRYWIQIYCKDMETIKVSWDIPVPDTLQFIPTNGWDKIPYDLVKVR